MIVPAGFHFMPTDQELLIHYLRRKTMGQQLPVDLIPEKELYSDDPWNVFKESEDFYVQPTDDGSRNRKVFYAFARLSNVGNGKKNKVRAVGCGRWHGQTGATDVFLGGKTKIGTKSTFTFRPNKGYVERGHWIMHELELPPTESSPGNNNYVVCRIIKEERKGCKNEYLDESSMVSEVVDFVYHQERGEVGVQGSGKRRKSGEEDDRTPLKKRKQQHQQLWPGDEEIYYVNPAVTNQSEIIAANQDSQEQIECMVNELFAGVEQVDIIAADHDPGERVDCSDVTYEISSEGNASCIGEITNNDIANGAPAAAFPADWDCLSIGDISDDVIDLSFLGDIRLDDIMDFMPAPPYSGSSFLPAPDSVGLDDTFC